MFSPLDALHLDKVCLVGWSDGATVALTLAMRAPERVAGVFFFGGNMDLAGVKQIGETTPTIDRMLKRHAKDYARLSVTPEQFESFAAAVVLMMRTEPNYAAEELARIRVPVAIAQSERDEFIKREHAEYLARIIPGAELVGLNGVSHFAPLQRPAEFDRALHAFLKRSLRSA